LKNLAVDEMNRWKCTYLLKVNNSVDTMDFPEKEQKVIRRYLLGKLDERQCEQLEERVLISPAFKMQVMIAEDELAEDYVSGRLSSKDQEAFRRRFLLTREQNQRIEIIRTLGAYAVQQPPVHITVAANNIRAQPSEGIKLPSFLLSRPALILLGVILVLAVGGAFWLVRRSSSPRTDPDDLTRRREIEREVSRLNPTGNQPLPPELTAHISSVILTPNLLRGAGETPKVETSSKVSVVQFHLKLPLDGYESYRVALYTSKGIELLHHDGLTSQSPDNSKDLIFNMPSSALHSDDYRLNLSGYRNMNPLEEVADYYFRVVRNNAR
jgi:hypothetical protein